MSTLRVGPINREILERIDEIWLVSKDERIYPNFRVFVLMVSFRFLFGIGAYGKRGPLNCRRFQIE